MGEMFSLPWAMLSDGCRRTYLYGDLPTGGTSGLVWGGSLLVVGIRVAEGSLPGYLPGRTLLGVRLLV